MSATNPLSRHAIRPAITVSAIAASPPGALIVDEPTGFSDLRAAGLKPVAVGAAQWLFLSALSYALARWLCGKA